jgi:hypothetical protein
MVMTTKQRKTRVLFSWRMLAIAVIAVIAANGLALLLIPQLSLRAAVRGSIIALGAILVGRLITWWVSPITIELGRTAGPPRRTNMAAT